MKKKSKFVNGPINVVQLEGQVGSVKKKIKIFMYVKVDIHDQTKCDDIRSIDISTFLVKMFDAEKKAHPKKMIDFMLQFVNIHLLEKNQKGSYLQQVRTTFDSAIKFDPETHKIKPSDLIPNVRFHYTGIFNVWRNSPDAIDNILSIVDNIWRDRSYNLNTISHLYENIDIVGLDILRLHTYFFNKDGLPKLNPNPTPEDKQVEKFVQKLTTSYTNQSIKKTINHLINTELQEQINEYIQYERNIFDYLKTEQEFLKPFGDNYSFYDILQSHSDGTYGYGPDEADLNKKLLHFEEIGLNIDTFIYGKIILYLTDLNILRRVLDKNYIDDVIWYMNCAHAINCIRLLVKYFNFKITNWFYLKNDDVNQCQKIIKESKSYLPLTIFFLPPLLVECIDVGSIPDFIIS